MVSCRELRLAASRACLPQFTHCHHSSVASSCLPSIYTKASSENCCTFCCTHNIENSASRKFTFSFFPRSHRAFSRDDDRAQATAAISHGKQTRIHVLGLQANKQVFEQGDGNIHILSWI